MFWPKFLIWSVTHQTQHLCQVWAKSVIWAVSPPAWLSHGHTLNKLYLVKPVCLATAAKENKQSSVAMWCTALRYLEQPSENSARNSSHASWHAIDSCSRHWQRSLNLSSTKGVLNLETCLVLEDHKTNINRSDQDLNSSHNFITLPIRQ